MPKAIQLSLDDWKHIQPFDYEHLPLKCKACHEYGHFSKNFPKNIPPKQGSQDEDE
jgi:hypothetical protein